jgi:hypothetical protein
MTIEFQVAPWMFGEGPPDDPFPCRCSGDYCERHNVEVQAWFRRMDERYNNRDAPNVWDDGLPPGGYVCAACGQPTESEPCADHQPFDD